MQGVTTVMTGIGEFDQRSYEVPDPEPNGAILEMTRANVCGSELHILKGHHPLIGIGCSLGHEGAGRVARLGEEVATDFAGQPLAEGDRVVSTYFEACRHCANCNRGMLNLCTNAYRRWSSQASKAPHFFGTFGTHWALSGNQYMYKIPDTLSDRAAAGANCALSQMIAAIDAAKLRQGEKIVFLGAGGLGLCGAALASKTGAEVYMAETNANRLPKGLEFGAHHLVDLSAAHDSAGRVDLLTESTGKQTDVLVDLTGVPGAFSEGVKSLRPGGRFISVGNISPGLPTEFDPGLFTRSGASMHAVIRYTPTFLARALTFMESTPDFPWDDLVDGEFTFEQIEEAVKATQNRTVTRAGITF